MDTITEPRSRENDRAVKRKIGKTVTCEGCETTDAQRIPHHSDIFEGCPGKPSKSCHGYYNECDCEDCEDRARNQRKVRRAQIRARR